jgi:hypothetical protein
MKQLPCFNCLVNVFSILTCALDIDTCEVVSETLSEKTHSDRSVSYHGEFAGEGDAVSTMFTYSI